MLNVVLRTCDRVSLANDRIVPKKECIIRCLNSLVKSLDQSKQQYCLYIIDDNSSDELKSEMARIAPEAIVSYLPSSDQVFLNNKQKSRHSVKVAYDLIDSFPEDDLVYIVEDDYLHYSHSIEKMIEAWNYFNSFDPSVDVGIFPQDFNQLYSHPDNSFNYAYVRPCLVVPGPDRYYRTTWFTHESFLIQNKVIKKYKEDFNKLMDIGYVDGAWEGSSISNVWQRPDVKMLMPLGTLAIHVSLKSDISFYVKDFDQLWESNAV